MRTHLANPVTHRAEIATPQYQRLQQNRQKPDYFGLADSASFRKRGSFRSGSNIGSSKMNVPEGTVLAHANRKGWTREIETAKQNAKTQSEAITPMEALAVTLNERKDKSRLHLSKYVVDASERAAQSNGSLEIAGKVQKVAQVHDSVWPEKEQQGSGVMGGLAIYSQQTVIAVKTRESD